MAIITLVERLVVFFILNPKPEGPKDVLWRTCHPRSGLQGKECSECTPWQGVSRMSLMFRIRLCVSVIEV